jgi:hypothetical protein
MEGWSSGSHLDLYSEDVRFECWAAHSSPFQELWCSELENKGTRAGLLEKVSRAGQDPQRAVVPIIIIIIIIIIMIIIIIPSCPCAQRIKHYAMKTYVEWMYRSTFS